jgi:Zn-dependent peptidase ImmA (M78 family)/DNA-binding XRE family transcriptional regulator
VIHVIGERIKIARQIKRLSLRELSGLVGVSHTAISKYETGLAVPSSAILLKLSDALGVELDFFLRPIVVEVEQPAFRTCNELSKREQERVLRLVQEWAERYLAAERLVFADSPPANWLTNIQQREISSVDEAEEVAEDARKQLELGMDPIESIVDLLEGHGVKVGVFDLEEKFEACTFMVNKEPVIASKETEYGDRQSFSIAHELGHILIHPRKEKLSEETANRFAGAFIAPRDAVFMELGEKRRQLSVEELIILKRRYKLSMQGWLHRVRDLGIVSERYYIEARKTFRDLGWQKEEPGEQIPSESPERLKMLILHSLSEGRISQARAAELFGIPLRQFLMEKLDAEARPIVRRGRVRNHGSTSRSDLKALSTVPDNT